LSPLALAQNAAPEKPSKIDAMIQVVKNPDTPAQLRLANAQALLQDPQAHPTLIAVLQAPSDNGQAHAQIIICRAIAGLNVDPLSVNRPVPVVPTTFIEPLFKILLADNPPLSMAAAHALVKCHDGVAKRLAQLVSDRARTAAQRLAGISALELIPGRQSVLTLADLLNDQDRLVRERAAAALAEMLYLVQPLDIQRFLETILPQLRRMDEPAFLHWLLERYKNRLRDVDRQFQENRQKKELWRERYLKAQTEKFNLIAGPDEKIKFLKDFLVNNQEELLRNWALERIMDWSKTTSVSTGPLAKQLVELLGPLIADPQPKIRQLTALALARLEFKVAQTTAPALLEQLKKETDPEARAALLSALGTFEATEALTPALAFLNQDPNSQPVQVFQEAVRAIGKICSAKAKTLAPEQIEQITMQLAQTFPPHQDNLELRSE